MGEDEITEELTTVEKIEAIFSLLSEVPIEDVVDIKIDATDNSEKIELFGKKEATLLKEPTQQTVDIQITWNFGPEWAGQQLLQLQSVKKALREQLQEVNSLEEKYREMISNVGD